MDLQPSSIVSSRRLTGANLFLSRHGAVLEIALDEPDRDVALARWRPIVRHLLDRLGWSSEQIVVRVHPGGAHCFVSAPLDGLLAATEVNERGWLRALAPEPPTPAETDDDVARLRVHQEHERNSRLVALQRRAAALGLLFTADDDSVSVGGGRGATTFPLRDIPAEDAVDWSRVMNVPTVLVTGSNGKTTTTRLVAAMLAETGVVVGLASTDGVQRGGEFVAKGDYSGPAGARLVLRDPAIGAAVLETARGGILRRGVATSHADVAIITNVAADHLNDQGITSLEALGEVKGVVTRVVASGGRVVLNADDPVLVALAPTVPAPVVWTSLDATHPVVTRHVAAGGEGCILDGHDVVHLAGGQRQLLGDVRTMPIALGGHARYNVANLLTAAAAACALGVDADAIRRTLVRFGASPGDNRGRLVRLEREGVHIVVDFVHNPDGWRALYAALDAIPAHQRIVVVGQAGDRNDAAIAALAHAVAAGAPALVVLKELPGHLRGRETGEVTALLRAALLTHGVKDSALRYAPNELEAVALALGSATAGDLMILAVHSNYEEVMSFLFGTGARPVTAPGPG